jgi:type II secretory pathway predicted ATPase ExeA
MEKPSRAQRNRLRLEATPDDRVEVRELLADYLERTGLTEPDFAKRIGYSTPAIRLFASDRWHRVAGSSKNIIRAIREFIAAHPIAPITDVFGDLYETANLRAIRATFQRLLRRPVSYMIYGPPGSQKSFVLQHLISELNRDELTKKDAEHAAYYVYAMAQATPSQLMKAVAIACGSSAAGDRARIGRNLAHQFQGRRVLLVVDEAQHLSINALETLRMLLDCPPHFSLLFAGSHDLKQTFDRQAAHLEQWNSRIIAKVCLPGVERPEAEAIVWRELGDWLDEMTPDKARNRIAALVDRSEAQDAFELDDKKRPRKYVNVRTLTNSIEQIKMKRAAPAKDLVQGETLR